MGYSSGYREEYRSPKMVKAVRRLFRHLSALSELFKEDESDLSLIRGAAIVGVVYILGDASGLGFGS